MNKKTILAAVLCIAALVVNAAPQHHFSHGGYWGRPTPVYGHSYGWGGHHVHRGGTSYWGHGGRNFWPAFAGGVVGGIVGAAIATPAPVVYSNPSVVVAPQPVVVQPQVIQAPPVVQQTTVIQQPVARQVFVPGRYIEVWSGNGYVKQWQPGHYETVYQ